MKNRPQRGDNLTWQARVYLLIVTLRHFGGGLLCLAAADRFTSPSYSTIRQILPLQVWGVLLMAIGFHAACSVAFDRELWARAVLVASACVTGAWAAGYAITAVQGHLDAPMSPLVWAALMLKDVDVSAMRLRMPLEEVARSKGFIA